MATIPITERISHKIGSHYKHGSLGEEYVLAQVRSSKVALISMCGNRFHDPIHVERIFDITEEEWGTISCSSTGVRFIPIEEFKLEQPSENVCICKKIEIPEIIPQISVGFRFKCETVLCYVQVQNKLRVGVARHSIKDEFKPYKGEKLAFRRALKQHDLCLMVRTALWEQYLVSRGITKESNSILEFFKNADITYSVYGIKDI